DVGGSAKFFRVPIEQHLTQVIKAVRHFKVITICFQLRQNLEDTREDIEVGSCADVSFVRRKAIDNKRNLQILPIRSLQAMPTLQSSGDARATIFQWRGLDTLLWNTAEDEWLGGAVNFRNGHLHSRLHRI